MTLQQVSVPWTATSIANAIALSVANIDSPTELGSIAGVISGELRLCYQPVAGANEWTLYAWDSTSSASANSPYSVNGSSGQWQAVTGKYVNGALNLGAAQIINIGAGGALTVRRNSAYAAGGGQDIQILADDGTNALGSGNQIGDLLFQGRRSVSNISNTASISVAATEAWGSTASGSQMFFKTTPNGSTTRTAALTLGQDQSATFVGALTAASLSVTGGGKFHQLEFEVTGVNCNAAATDVATITGLPAKYRISTVTVYDASISLTTATFSVYTGAGGTGTAAILAQPLSPLTAPAKFKSLTRETIVTTDYFTATTLFLRCVTAQGSAATMSVLIEIEDLT